MSNEAHVRADDGIERGPKHNQQPVPARIEGQSWTIPPDLDADLILHEYLCERETSGIAAKHGIRRAALTRWLQQQRPEEWKEVQRIRALCTKEEGTELIYDARTGLQLGRARALRAAGEWDLERLDEDFRAKSDVRIEHTGDLGERLRRADARVIDGVVVKQHDALPQLPATASGDSAK